MRRLAITGGTGSLGSALVAHALATGIERLVVLSRDEVKQDALRERSPDPRLNLFLGDVRDRERCRMAFYGCDTVVHAAALKRVTRGAHDPWEFLKTNVLGTTHVVLAALEAGVRRVLVISSDKAVEATNLYGKTKALAEDLAVQANSYTYPQGCRVSVLRYGNVLGSRGSVLERWQAQVARGEPLTLTHPDMTRFLISLPQAVALVQTCLEVMEGGEIFVPVLPSARVEALAEACFPGHPRCWTGVRPGGEKFHEALLSREEVSRIALAGPALWRVLPSHASWRAAWPPPDRAYPLTSAWGELAGADLAAWVRREGVG